MTGPGQDGVKPRPTGRTRRPGEGRAKRILIKIETQLIAPLAAEAQVCEMAPARWVEALLHRHLLGRVTLRRGDELAFNAIHAELRRVGVHISHVLGVLAANAQQGVPSPPQVEALEAFRSEVRDHLASLRATIAHELSYWETEP